MYANGCMCIIYFFLLIKSNKVSGQFCVFLQISIGKSHAFRILCYILFFLIRIECAKAIWHLDVSGQRFVTGWAYNCITFFYLCQHTYSFTLFDEVKWQSIFLEWTLMLFFLSFFLNGIIIFLSNFLFTFEFKMNCKTSWIIFWFLWIVFFFLVLRFKQKKSAHSLCC